ncbi:hypothetical protein WJX72_008885 [[Myrmecia] bisecta]|uniref:Rab5-interacting protein n=1 Tax=[Myrmecia] bisecta TaxID=41462 RepID=A0AAW1R8J7_9CHLO
MQGAVTNLRQTWEKEEMLDAIYWLRHLLALPCGIVWGVAGLTGAYALLSFVALMGVATLAWYRTQGIDEEDFGGHQVLQAEGLGPATALFLLTWIITYSFVRF